MNRYLKPCEKYYVPMGRIIVGAYFVLAGLPKLIHLEATAEMIAGVNFPAPMFFAILAALLETGAGLALMINRYASYAALLLSGFVFIISFPFHGPHLWEESMMQHYTFMKNIALVGALLFMAAHLDRPCGKTKGE